MGKIDSVILSIQSEEAVQSFLAQIDRGAYSEYEEYLARAEREGVVLDVSGDLPKSFVLCDHPYHRQIVYLSQLNSATLQKRGESSSLEFE